VGSLGARQRLERLADLGLDLGKPSSRPDMYPAILSFPPSSAEQRPAADAFCGWTGFCATHRIRPKNGHRNKPARKTPMRSSGGSALADQRIEHLRSRKSISEYSIFGI
jgi:hypothetical protein